MKWRFFKFSSDCIFAHEENLRENLYKKSEYKKHLFLNFFQKGFYIYGNRCQFSHSLKQKKILKTKKHRIFHIKIIYMNKKFILWKRRIN